MSTQLPAKIHAARKAAGLTQERLAEQVGVTRGAVTQWESRNPDTKSNPGMDHLRKVAEVTGLPFAWLLDDRYSPGDAVHVRNLNRQGKWHEMDVKVEGEQPDGMPHFTRATMIEPFAALLHTEDRSFQVLPDGAQPVNQAPHRHPRLGQLFWNTVQYQLLTRAPDLDDCFERRLDSGLRPDFFDGHNLIEFTSYSNVAPAMLQVRRILGDVLLEEKIWGHEVRKFILCWGSTPEEPHEIGRMRELCRQADTELRYFTEPGEAVDFIHRIAKRQ